MNNIQPILPQTSPVWPEVNASTAKTNMSAPQVGASELPIRDSVIAAGKTDLPEHKSLADSLEAPHREMVRQWQNTQIEVRPGEVKKAIEWNLDPSYPRLNVLNGIASMLVGSVLSDAGSNLKGQILP
ncbi:MAG: hypothetical protein WCG66_09605 [bacterium]